MGGQHDIFIINPDGTGLTALANTAESESIYYLAPDDRIVFTSTDIEEYIYIVNPDGTGRIPLATTGATKTPEDVF
jgi:hypothetical protein